MKSRRQNVSDDPHQTSLGSSNTISIPDDLVSDILSRLPAKSIARYRCVSKHWASILNRSDLTDNYFTRSSARPQLLFACEKNGRILFYSSSQPKNSDDTYLVPVNYLMSFPCEHVYRIYSPVRGLISIRDDRIFKGRKTPTSVVVICNPSTGQSFVLPKMITRKRTDANSFFGYDPVEKQFKVLSMVSVQERGSVDIKCKDLQVLTIGSSTEDLSWRLIECGIIPHSHVCDGICINGVLFYKASVGGYSGYRIIVCFDFRSEKFSLVRVDETFDAALHCSNLVKLQ
ncbi:unnamed protein product [Cochlearia groenlandica]